MSESSAARSRFGNIEAYTGRKMSANDIADYIGANFDPAISGRRLISTGQAKSGGVLVAVRDSGPGFGRHSRSPLRGLLYHQDDRLGDGSIDLPLDHRSAWGTIVGAGEQASG